MYLEVRHWKKKKTQKETALESTVFDSHKGFLEKIWKSFGVSNAGQRAAEPDCAGHWAAWRPSIKAGDVAAATLRASRLFF